MLGMKHLHRGPLQGAVTWRI